MYVANGTCYTSEITISRPLIRPKHVEVSQLNRLKIHRASCWSLRDDST
jgi:hypothetical protein